MIDPSWDPKEGIITFFKVDCCQGCGLWIHNNCKHISPIARRELDAVGWSQNREISHPLLHYSKLLQCCTLDPVPNGYFSTLWSETSWRTLWIDRCGYTIDSTTNNPQIIQFYEIYESFSCKNFRLYSIYLCRQNGQPTLRRLFIQMFTYTVAMQ